MTDIPPEKPEKPKPDFFSRWYDEIFSIPAAAYLGIMYYLGYKQHLDNSLTFNAITVGTMLLFAALHAWRKGRP